MTAHFVPFVSTTGISIILDNHLGSFPSCHLTRNSTNIETVFHSWYRHSVWHMCISVCVCVCGVCAQSCLTLWDPMGCSLPGSSVHGISQARILEWVVIPFFRGSSQARDRTCISLHWQVDSLPLSHLGSPSWWGQWSWKLLKRNKNQHLFRVHYVSVSALKYFTSIILSSQQKISSFHCHFARMQTLTQNY